MKMQRLGRCLSGVALVVIGAWVIMAGQWSLKLAPAGWMWGLSLGAGLVIAGLGVAIAVIGARHSSNYGRLANTWALFGGGIALLGILMIVAAQWLLAVTGLGICYYWRSSVGIGSFALLLGVLTTVQGLRGRLW